MSSADCVDVNISMHWAASYNKVCSFLILDGPQFATINLRCMGDSAPLDSVMGQSLPVDLYCCQSSKFVWNISDFLGLTLQININSDSDKNL